MTPTEGLQALPKSEKKVKLMIDSGAFSAWRKHDPIDVKKYIAYVKKHEHLIDEVVNLDVIPGVYPKPPTAEEREKSAQEGWDNLMRMADAGIKAIPVYHQGERFYWLDKMFNAGYDYIGISPDNSRALSSKKEWLTSVFRDICDSEGDPVFKTHGFAVTAVELMFKFPWHSYDSMTWLLAASYGGIFIPKVKEYRENGESIFDFSRIPFTIKISKESPTIELGTHYQNLTPMERANCEAYFESEGFTLDALQGSFVPRTILNLRCLRRVESPYDRTNFKDRNSFFPENEILKEKGIKDNSHEFITAINLARKYSDILTDEKKFERLFTYALLRETQDGFLDTYVYTGRMPVREK